MHTAILLLSVIIVAVAIISFFIGKFHTTRGFERRMSIAQLDAKDIIEKAEFEARAKKKEASLEAKEQIIQMKSDAEEEIKQHRMVVQKLENRLLQREEYLDKRSSMLEKKEIIYVKKNEEIEIKRKDLDKLIKKSEEEISLTIKRQREKLEEISNFTMQEAEAYLLDSLKSELISEKAQMIRKIEASIKEEASKKARELISIAIQRCAVEHVSETTVTVVNLPNEDMKGRIIGREGRNIRTLEALTGVDLIIDDTPEAVILSGFDAMRREVAKIALEKLIIDGRVHPARIEDVVRKAQKEVETAIIEEGESAMFRVGLQGIHPEVIRLLGKMKFRTSYGQNVLDHSIEVAHLCGVMAAELGLDIALAKRAGLLHDIGKAIDHDMEGSHVRIGSDLCKRYKEHEIVINAIESHHGEVEPVHAISVLVKAADSISAARPGARREVLE